ncbi:MAG: hypothetical protein MUF18_06720 [Fimbriiglobus sp.]|jgi:hypothetical protein|nr:hypothetical protein [Fimbriiglobus sp.]
MSRIFWRRAAIVLALLTGAVFSFGCGPGMMWHMLKGEELMKAEHPLSLPEGKREVTVAVSVTSQYGVPAGADLELSNKIGSQLKALSEVNKDTRVVVVDQSKVNAFKANNPDRWNIGNPGDFATQLGADYWLDVNVDSLKLMDRDFGGEICRGSATLRVAVYEAGKAEPKYSYPFTHQAQLKPSDPMQIGLYRDQYLGQLASQIAFKHVKYKADQKRAAEK